MKRFVIALSVLLFALTGCQPTSSPTTEANLSQEFKLKVGQEATIKGTDLAVLFQSVLEDSRCPKNVQCVQAGEATIELIVRVIAAKSSPFRLTLGTLPAHSQTTESGITIQLKKLDPYPEILNPYPGAPQPKIAPQAYEATLVVLK